MKKTLPLFVILLLLCALTFGSEYIIHRRFETLEQKILATEASTQEDDFETALYLATECIDYYLAQEKVFVCFLPSESLSLFQTSIYGMQTYLEEENRTEALAEAARAHAQLNAIRTLYFRMI